MGSGPYARQISGPDPHDFQPQFPVRLLKEAQIAGRKLAQIRAPGARRAVQHLGQAKRGILHVQGYGDPLCHTRIIAQIAHEIPEVGIWRGVMHLPQLRIQSAFARVKPCLLYTSRCV